MRSNNSIQWKTAVGQTKWLCFCIRILQFLLPQHPCSLSRLSRFSIMIRAFVKRLLKSCAERRFLAFCYCRKCESEYTEKWKWVNLWIMRQPTGSVANDPSSSYHQIGEISSTGQCGVCLQRRWPLLSLLRASVIPELQSQYHQWITMLIHAPQRI